MTYETVAEKHNCDVVAVHDAGSMKLVNLLVRENVDGKARLLSVPLKSGDSDDAFEARVLRALVL